MNPDTVQVVIYDAPAVKSSSCGCGCSGHGHDHHGPSGDPLAGVSLEMQAKALALLAVLRSIGNAPTPGGLAFSGARVAVDTPGIITSGAREATSERLIAGI